VPFLVLEIVLATAPSLVLAAAGIILYNRKHNLATMLAAVGFAAVAATQIYGAILALSLTPGAWSPHGWAYALLRWGTVPSHWAIIVGSWFAAAGLLWHALGGASAAPNNRWRGP